MKVNTTPFDQNVRKYSTKSLLQLLELRRLRKAPRYKELTTNILGRRMVIPDGRSFYYSYQEIVNQRVYEFLAQNERPRIIDGGANVGLSVLFFKMQYPKSEVIAFEADSKIFDILKTNVETFDVDGVTLINKALWSEDRKLAFRQEGADAGRIVGRDDVVEAIEVNTTRLSPYLRDDDTEFLKLDVEGAEYEVLSDCADVLRNVRRIFVEYHSFVDRPQRLHEILTILRDSGFRLQIHTQFASPQPLLQTRERDQMDLQLNIFGRRS